MKNKTCGSYMSFKRRCDSYLELGPHSVRPRYEDRINKSCSLQVKQPCEAPEFCTASWKRRKKQLQTGLLLHPLSFECVCIKVAKCISTDKVTEFMSTITKDAAICFLMTKRDSVKRLNQENKLLFHSLINHRDVKSTVNNTSRCWKI